MADSLIFQIVPINKSAANAFEDQIKRLFSFLQKEMNMVSHQAVGIELVLAHFFAFPQNRQKTKIVFFVFKYLLLVDPPQHNVVDAGGAFLSLRSWHSTHPTTLYL